MKIGPSNSICGSQRGFSPAAVSSLAVWLDAQDLSTFTFSSGNDVLSWANKGNTGGGNATNVTANQQPLYVASAINARPAVQFYDDNTVKQLAVADSAAIAYTQFTCFSVVQRVADIGASEIIQAKWNPVGNQRGFEQLITSTDNTQMFTSPDGSATGLATANGATLGLATPGIIMGYYDGTNIGSSLNNAGLVTAATASVFSGSSAYTIGSISTASPAAPFAGHIGELLFYKSLLSASERLQILQYLAAKWAITIS